MGKRYSELLNIASWLDFIVGSWLCIDTASGAKKIPAEMLSSLKHLQVESNDEFLYAVSDSNGRFLFGIQRDGSVEWMKGIPKPVRDMFSRVLEILKTKVDKEAGKSLINKTFADGVSVVSNEEFLYAISDSEGAFLFGIKRDGSIEWSKGVPGPIREVLDGILDTKVDKEEGKGLIDQTFAEGVSAVSDKEFLVAFTDANGKFLFGVQRDGSFQWSKGVPAIVEDLFNKVFSALGKKVDKETGKSLIDGIFASGVRAVSNNEFIIAFTDSNDKFLFGVQKDGSFTYGASSQLSGHFERIARQFAKVASQFNEKVDKEEGKSLISSAFANGVSVFSNSEYVFAIKDSNDIFLFGIKTDGSVTWNKGVPLGIQNALTEIYEELNEKQDKVEGKTVVDNELSEHCLSVENPEWFWVLIDEVGKIVEGIQPTGEHVFKLPLQLDGGVNWTKENLSELQQALKENGFQGGTGDWSDKSSLEIPVPKMAIINFTNISQMPQAKDTNAHAVMEFWDMNGNYFKKKVIANAQGSSSMKWSKKNIGIDICNDDWEGDDTFKVKFGEWVPQDSFHIKAYATDYFKCVGLAGYDIVKEMMDSRPLNTTWKQNLNYGSDPIGAEDVSTRIDTGALCYPQGFICKVYLNGNFEGLFCWQLKKHRDNYNMKKSNTKHIHIEGMLGASYFWNGTIDWTQFEIRNPKDLITYNGGKYDGDNPTELIDSTSPSYDASNSKHRNTAAVKQYIINLSQRMIEINNAGAGSDKTLFEKYFGLDSCIDYAVLSDAVYNYDYMKNIQWTTWDGEKWFLNFYDMDCTLGANSSADSIHYPTSGHTTTATMHPLNFLISNYTSELEARWRELRDLKIIDAKNIIKKIEHYMKTWGADAYDAENAKWPDYPYNRDMVVDEDDWELEVDEDGNPVIYTSTYHQWNSSTNYAAGYVVQYNPSTSSQPSQGWWYRFTAVQANSNKPPVTQTGFKDNIFRVYNWLKMQIENMDTLYNYT